MASDLTGPLLQTLAMVYYLQRHITYTIQFIHQILMTSQVNEQTFKLSASKFVYQIISCIDRVKRSF